MDEINFLQSIGLWIINPGTWAAALGAVVFYGLEYIVWSRKPRIQRDERDMHYFGGFLVFVLLAAMLGGIVNIKFKIGMYTLFYVMLSGPAGIIGYASRLGSSPHAT